MKKRFQILAVAAMLAASTVTAMAGNITPVPVPKTTADAAAAWAMQPGGPALVEMLSRRPDHPLTSRFAGAQLPAMPIKGMVLNPTGSSDEIEEVLRRAPKRVIPNGTNVGGFMCYNTLGYDLGYYSIPLESSSNLTLQSLFPDLDINGFHGGAASEKYAVFSFSNSYIQNGLYSGFTAIVDRTTWQVLGCKGDYGETDRWAYDMTYDETTKRFYGCFLNRDQTAFELCYMDLDEVNPGATVNNIRRIAELPVGLMGIAADGSGNLWGITFAGQLVTINRKTAELTLVVNTNIKTSYNGSLTWDKNRGILYWAICYDRGDDVKSALCTIDPETGEVTYINDFDNKTAQIGSLFADFAAKDASPAAPQNMSVNFQGFEYSGNVTFDAPTTLEDGTPATGALQAQLTVKNAATYVQVFDTTIDIEYGQTGIEIPLTMTNAGNYIFTLRAINDDGPSYSVEMPHYVGIDHPSPVKNINMTCENGTFVATWAPVTEPVNGGYFNTDELEYNVVVRLSNAQGGASVLLETTTPNPYVSVPVEDTTDLRAFRVSVVPVCSGVSGDPTETSWKWFGYLSAPFVDPMTNAGAWTTECIYGNNWSCTSSGWGIPYEWGNYNMAWLYSPAVYLEEGDVYNISFRAYSEVVLHTGKVCIGKAPNSESMTKELCSYGIIPRATRTVSTVYVCPESGVYYFGILNNTASDTWTNYPYVYLTNFNVSAVSHDAPAAPELEVTRNPSGALEVPIKLTLPSTTLGGGELEGPLSAKIKRAGTVIWSEEDLEPGQVVEFTDTVPRDDEYSYSAVVANAEGEGAPVIVNQFIGVGQPRNPAWVKDHEGEVGEVVVEWAPVTRDINGMELDEDAVTYHVINVLQNAYMEKDVKGDTYSYQACSPERQEGVYMSVNANTRSGESSLYGTYSSTGLHFVGTPTSLPLHETFERGKPLQVPWLVVNQSSAYDGFTIADMMEEEGIMDANGDGQALMGFVPYHASSCCVYTGAIDVPANANAPALRYAVLNTNFGRDENDNENKVDIFLIVDDDESAWIESYKLNSMPLGWNYRTVDLGLLKGKKVHIMVQLTTYSYTTYYLDDFLLFDRKNTDIALSNISIPAKVEPGERFNIYVEAFNQGLNKVGSEAKVELYRDDNLISTRGITQVSSLQSTTVGFRDKLELVDAPEAKYKAVLKFDNDQLADNNQIEASTRIAVPNFPVPTQLEAKRSDNGYPMLTWVAPDLTPQYKTTLSAFESFQGYSITHLEGFSSVDVTGNPKEITNFDAPHGWELCYSPSLSHSGNCFLMSGACVDGAAKEDWLISPKLSGREQTVSFYIATDWDAHENYYVYTSTTGNEVADFGTEPVLSGRTLSNNWEKISIDLPEGTTYFAIVAKEDDTTGLQVLMVDDVTYEGVPANSDLDFAGYRAYRDRESIEMETPLTEPTFEDNGAGIGGHFYRITALYAGGALESAPTDEVYVFSRGGAPDSGVDDVEALGGRVTVLHGAIKVELDSAAQVALYDYSGKVLFCSTIDGTVTIPALPGTYVLTIDGAPLRLMVK